MTTCADWVERLAEADDALHQLTIGKKPEQMRYADKQTVYTAADRLQLVRWRAECQRHVDACNGVRSTTQQRRFAVIPH